MKRIAKTALSMAFAFIAVPAATGRALAADSEAAFCSEAVPALSALVQNARQKGLERQTRPQDMSFAAAASGALNCKCTDWSSAERWQGRICVDKECTDQWGRPSRNPADCRCWKYDTIYYLQSTCREWKQNFCYDLSASLSPQEQAPAPAQPGSTGNASPALRPVSASVGSCPGGREISHDATVTRCGTRYQRDGYDWSYTDPWGNSSCLRRTVRLHDCVDDD